MKFCSLLLALLLVFIPLTTHSKAQYINQQFDPSLYTETKIAKPISKIIVTKVQRQQILKISDQKYSQEFAYFFYKLGFKRPPVSFILFDNGNVATLNSDWQFNQPHTNLDQGVLFILMVYDGVFSSDKFQVAINQFTDTTLKNTLGSLNLASTNDIEMRQFVVENVGDDPILTFNEAEDSQTIRSQFKNLDFSTKTLPDLKVMNVIVPAKANPSTIVNAQITIINNSNFDYVFGPNETLQFKFENDSAFFTNNKWLNLRTPLVFKDGTFRSKESKTFTLDLSLSVIPGQIKEKMNIEFGGKVINSSDVSVTVNDTGQKILKIKPTELNYLNIRQDPSQASKEVGRASVGTVYLFTESQNNFYKIIFNNNQSGWVSARYVEIIK